MLVVIEVFKEYFMKLHQHVLLRILFIYHITNHYDHLLLLFSIYLILKAKDDHFIYFLMIFKPIQVHVKYHKLYTKMVLKDSSLQLDNQYHFQHQEHFSLFLNVSINTLEHKHAYAEQKWLRHNPVFEEHHNMDYF